MTFKLDVKKFLIFLFVALGPLGNLPTPHFLPSAFRAYYFVLPLFFAFFLFSKERISKIALFFLPFLIYSFISVSILAKFGTANETHTQFRFFLFVCQFLFVLGAASHIKEKEEVFQLLKTYLMFFFISLAVGFFFFIGFYLKIVPLKILTRFSVLTQFGFGILRFSPGSYPNEYGIVASFVLSILSLIFLEKRVSEFGWSKKFFFLFFLMTFLAFLLATTRAAYLSFAVCFLYISWTSKHFAKILAFSSLGLICVFSFLKFLNFNMFSILVSGFSQKLTEGSLGERYFVWVDTLERAKEHPILGLGFASVTNIHNVYFQLLFELGAFGFLLLLGSILLSWVESFFRYQRFDLDEKGMFFQRVRRIGLITVLSFAASNHNLNHHLTWFILFLCFVAIRYPYLSRGHSRLKTGLQVLR